jgi:hypothetical protein
MHDHVPTGSRVPWSLDSWLIRTLLDQDCQDPRETRRSAAPQLHTCTSLRKIILDLFFFSCLVRQVVAFFFSKLHPLLEEGTMGMVRRCIRVSMMQMFQKKKEVQGWLKQFEVGGGNDGVFHLNNSYASHV